MNKKFRRLVALLKSKLPKSKKATKVDLTKLEGEYEYLRNRIVDLDNQLHQVLKSSPSLGSRGRYSS